MTCGIYEIVHLASSKRYVGSSIDVDRRWGEHLRQIRGLRHSNPKLMNYMLKYGEEAFSFNLIASCTPDELLPLEQTEIDKGAELNISPIAGNTLGRPVSEKARANYSAARVKMWEDPEYREAQVIRTSAQCEKQWKDPSVREKMAAGIKRDKQDGFRTGRLTSPLIKLWENKEYREANSGANNRNHDPEIYTFAHKQHGEFTGTKMDLHKVHGLDRSSVTKLAHGKLKTSKGWSIKKAPG